MYIIYMMNIISSQYSDEASQSGDTATLAPPRPPAAAGADRGGGVGDYRPRADDCSG